MSERRIYSEAKPVAVVAAPDLILAAYADGAIRGFPTRGPGSASPAHQFETIYP